MADTVASSYDLKIKFAFDEAVAPPLTVTLPNPASLSVIRAGMSTIENLAVDNNIITTADYPGTDFVQKVSDVTVVAKTETNLDWRN